MVLKGLTLWQSVAFYSRTTVVLQVHYVKIILTPTVSDSCNYGYGMVFTNARVAVRVNNSL